MKKLFFVMMVMMITSTTFSQHIGKAYIGLSLDSTINQCKSVKYELVKKGEEYAKFLIPNSDEEYDLDITLTMFASPKTKTVWFGVMTLESMNKKEAKLTFLSMIRAMQKKAVPYEKRRKIMRWDMGPSVVYIERDGLTVKCTVINTGAFSRTLKEHENE
jgi:hypothetical protein